MLGHRGTLPAGQTCSAPVQTLRAKSQSRGSRRYLKPVAGLNGGPAPSFDVPLGLDLQQYPRLEGRNVLITGAARGIGFNSARLAAQLGARLWLADIDTRALQAAVETIRQQVPGADVCATCRLNLGSQADVHAWVDAWQAGKAFLPAFAPANSTASGNVWDMGAGSTSSSGGTDNGSSSVSSSSSSAAASVATHSTGAVSTAVRSATLRTANGEGSAGGPGPVVDVLLNNAGANFMGVEPWFTEQGVAGLPQVNFVGPYTLTRRLAPQLAAGNRGRGGRVVNVASVMHRFSKLPEDPQFFLTDWWKGGAYRNCKHANVVFTLLIEQVRQQQQQQQQQCEQQSQSSESEHSSSGLSQANVFARGSHSYPSSQSSAGASTTSTSVATTTTTTLAPATASDMDNITSSSVGPTQQMQQQQQPPILGIHSAAVDPGAVYSGIWSTSKILGKPPGSTVISALFAPPWDAAATSLHAVAVGEKQLVPGGYYARGVFASDGIAKGRVEPLSGALSCLDWPLRAASRGALASHIAAADIAPEALSAARDGRGVALWNAAADLAGLPRWGSGL